MTFEELEKIYNTYRETEKNTSHDRKHIKFYKEDHVFDEEQSVKWNKEKVKEENQKLQAQFNKAISDFEDCKKKFYNSLYEYIKGEFDTYNTLTRRLFNKITSYIQENFEDDYYFENGLASATYRYGSLIKFIDDAVEILKGDGE